MHPPRSRNASAWRDDLATWGAPRACGDRERIPQAIPSGHLADCVLDGPVFRPGRSSPVVDGLLCKRDSCIHAKPLGVLELDIPRGWSASYIADDTTNEAYCNTYLARDIWLAGFSFYTIWPIASTLAFLYIFNNSLRVSSLHSCVVLSPHVRRYKCVVLFIIIIIFCEL